MIKTIFETVFFFTMMFGMLYSLKYAHAINQIIIELLGR